MTTLKDALQDPKQLVKLGRYKAGGDWILSAKALWVAVESNAWKKAEALGKADPSQYYCRPERWIPIAEWMALLDRKAVKYLFDSVEPNIAEDLRSQARAIGREGTPGDVLALQGSKLVDLYSREMLSTSELVPVVTHQGFFKVGDFHAKREVLPRGGFKPRTTPPDSQSTVEWTVLESVLMTVYSVGAS